MLQGEGFASIAYIDTIDGVTQALIWPQVDHRTLKERRWGGTRLAALRGGPDQAGTPIGESWEFSTMPGSESRANGRGLAEELGAALPLLAKLIDTALPLSIQVHPSDDPGTGAKGKEEAWIVLDAEPDAKILAGVKAGIDAQQFAERARAAVANPEGAGQALIDAFEVVPAVPGTVVLVPARTVHAIGAGILLAEIQQPADCTYRIFDYGSGRPIHTEQALETVDVTARPVLSVDGEHQWLRGEHVKLRVIQDGRLSFGGELIETPSVVVAATTAAVVEVDGTEAELPKGGLVLVRAGYEFAVDTRGRAVVGYVD